MLTQLSTPTLTKALAMSGCSCAVAGQGRVARISYVVLRSIEQYIYIVYRCIMMYTVLYNVYQIPFVSHLLVPQAHLPDCHQQR